MWGFPPTFRSTFTGGQVSRGSVSSNDGIGGDGGSSGPGALIDDNMGTYWDQSDYVSGPHFFELSGAGTFGGYEFVTYSAPHHAPAVWDVTCDGNRIDRVTNMDEAAWNQRGGGRYAHCFGVNHTCSRFKLSISSWSTGSPALRQVYLNPPEEVGSMQWDVNNNVCQLYMTTPTASTIDCAATTAARPICGCT